MSLQFIAFFILSLVTVGGSVFMISFGQQVIHQVIALAFSFLGIAGLFFLLDAEFVGITQILVYSGSITILMLFGIMLTRHDPEPEQTKKGPRIFSFAVVAAFFVIMFIGIQSMNIIGEPAVYSGQSNVKEIGLQLFTENVIPFELTSVLLLVAMVGAIVLAKREADDQ
ncbi:NADH:ubiquinone oxidoreductase subunit J [Ammoniphilus oxalaticus]|uniref:NADH-quinone oxidoreductase subunit J n=1 Tax=Ammoniphilus oxalaticus TaxID=66863 RepID=A0A419SH14_9BACL|nr:NADH-quinone oxidoreductase subunit J [Ammoniphilus oxalaticus]RKD23077.1 NADH:ubiquinone oxidoreductase subunit J [Ammoniphilus oxalaticus]